MALSVKHKKTSTIADDPAAVAAGQVVPSDWNDTHDITMATGKLLGRSTASAGSAEEISIGTGLSLSGGVLSAIDGVLTITDGASVDIDPASGGIQVWTLGANRTPTATNFTAGQAVTLMIADGTAFAVTWTTIGVVWVGGTAPTLPTTGYGVIELWKVGTTVYGAYVGAVA